ncbi:MAG: Coenzyme PQQ synthesis protein B [Chroococcidiopsis cubana SAG 39.79]|uniref:Coenzyme PQQ synthesis protein B n=1 Tax=Chroococcidiopsis cubana SAG 39.79 TaxID=388085 RepID=A0AB37UBS4_9CYAN|nr:pyrroloquinoline quinone biosynthesis protein PqqB [Chroococcidiopsis cubana]MDZ4871384.1 Coenzyme PQQ synthesis protein B [Chroococcidiopsis cubana SAG 39.79]PSB64756.1 pyrroloquinoline quinone biosynthesis protein PqqB [Chroococcidiopsis cubana CCALA 043]RUT04909.1 coenzyme PQQ synthesis protein B [Chroococcidiopsis cubana SAG 39.79]
MEVKILGTAAGGGLPQWNCYCPNCQAVRASSAGVCWLNQSSIAVRANNQPWFLVNASPDVRQQLELLRDGKPVSIRSSPIAGILLTDAEIDHTTGLILLRESSEPLRVYGTDTVRIALTEGFPLLSTLAGYCGVKWSLLEPGIPINLGLDAANQLEVEAFPLAAKPPKYMRHKAVADEVWVVGFTFRASGKVMTYAPGLAQLDDTVLERFESSDCILIDGTCWQDDELVSLGIANRKAREMGHLPLSGAEGSIQHLAQLRHPRKILVHINNTNPILMANSQERQVVEKAGIEVGDDGLTIEL